MVKNTHELIKEIENDTMFMLLLKKGIIPISILNYKCYYEKYLQELKTVKKVQAIANASEDYNVHENTIRNAIKFMEG